MTKSTLPLFMDFDGVTHPEPCFKDTMFCQLPFIEEVLREFQPVEIVISSSWREHYSLCELQDMFSPDIGRRIVGMTPTHKLLSSSWLPGSGPEINRQSEIEWWLRHNRPKGQRWLAIDDRPYWFNEGCPDLLQTHRSTGFTPEDKDRLRAMLKERL